MRAQLRTLLLPVAWRPEPRRLLPDDPSVATGPPLAREVAGALKPLTTVGTAPGAAGNAPALMLVAAALVLSLCPRRGPEPERPPGRLEADPLEADQLEADPLEARLAELEVELAAAVGSDSLCAISRTAGSVPAAKYLEGRLAALMALRRSLRGGESRTAALAALREEWHRGLEDVTARDAGADWQAYRAGGVDELEELEGKGPAAR